MSVDDSCDEEVVDGVDQASRRRLVLVLTQLESTRPTTEDTDGLQVDADVDGSDTESVVGSQRVDAQSTPDFQGNGKHGSGRVGRWVGGWRGVGGSSPFSVSLCVSLHLTRSVRSKKKTNFCEPQSLLSFLPPPHPLPPDV